jgi:hypothetical protein
MAEPRQPIGNLPGYGETSISAARPVDAFAGAPQLDKNPAIKQLADAFAQVGTAGRRAAQEAQAKREKERLALMKVEAEGTAKKMIAESETGIITAVQLGEHYADLSDAVVAEIVVQENQLSFYNMAKTKLSGLNDSIIMDKAGLEAIYQKLETDALTATDGFQFAQSGALSGIRSAIREMSGQHATRRDGLVRDRSKEVITGQVSQLLTTATNKDGTLNMEAITEGLAAIDNQVTPFDRVGRKGIIVDALLNWDIANPSNNPAHKQVIEAVPWLKGTTTDAKVADKAVALGNAQWNAYVRSETKKNNDEQVAITEGKGVINKLLQENNAKGLDELQASYAGKTDPVSVALYGFIETQKEAAKVPVDVSARNIVTKQQDITGRATTGKITLEAAIAEVEALTDARPEDKARLIAELPKLIQGFGIISTDAHNNAYRQRLGSVVDAYDKNPRLLGKQFALTGVGETADSIARDIWDNTTIRLIEDYMADNDNEPPSASALRKIYDQAEAVVQERLGLLRTINEAGTADQVRAQVDQIVNPPQPVNNEAGSGANGSNPPVVKQDDDPSAPGFTPSVGKAYTYPGTGEIFKYTGKGENPNDLTDDANWEKAYPEYGEVFDKENATLNIPDNYRAYIEKQVAERYREQGGILQDDIIEIVTDTLGLKRAGAGGGFYEDFDYTGLFDSVDEPGEIAMQKLVKDILKPYLYDLQNKNPGVDDNTGA